MSVGGSALSDLAFSCNSFDRNAQSPNHLQYVQPLQAMPQANQGTRPHPTYVAYAAWDNTAWAGGILLSEPILRADASC